MTTVTKTGLALVVLGCILWFGLLAIPFLELSVGQKAALAAVVFGLVQVLFWGGSLLAGREVIGRFMEKLWPRKWRFWSKKASSKSTPPLAEPRQQGEDENAANPALRTADEDDGAVEDHDEKEPADQRVD